ncbi:TPA: ATP-binding protein [Candidatus Micrarchaeota archaeon]|nr:ATP-binding protein [Candidatus Micrarchaeota archaeon]
MAPKTLDDYAGQEHIIGKGKLLRRAIEADRITSLILYGPPGTGKTMMMKALAKEMNIGFYYVKCSELLSEWYGESEKNISEVFAIGRKKAPCVLFFDEIDSIGKRRDSYTSDDVAPRVMSVMLEELDGFKSKKNVITIGATNAPDQLDPALMRPGRFDKIIYIPPPDAPARSQIFTTNLSKFLKSLDLRRLSDATEGFSGADVASICQEVKMQLVRDKLKGKPTELLTGHVMKVVSSRRPSITKRDLREYDLFKEEYGERK